VLSALGWLAKNLTQFLPIPTEAISTIEDEVSTDICYAILNHPNSLSSILDLFKYPHKSIKILAASLLSSLRYAMALDEQVSKVKSVDVVLKEQHDNLMSSQRLGTFK